MPDADLLINAFVYCNRTLGFVNAPVMMQRAVARMDDLRVDASAYKERRDLMVDILKLLPRYQRKLLYVIIIPSKKKRGLNIWFSLKRIDYD